MKKIILIFTSLIIAVSAMAQEVNRDTDGKLQFGPYETNGFWDNWFVGIGGGYNLGLENFKAIEYGWGLNTELYFGKHITPTSAVRFGWQGVNTSWDKKWAWPKENGSVTFNYFHADVMWNISNEFAGYNETRLVNVVPYLSAGFLYGHKTTSIGLGVGVEIPFRVSDRVSIVPDFRLIGSEASILHPTATGITCETSATISARINLGKTNWTRKSTTLAACNDKYIALYGDYATAKEALNNLNAKVKGLEDENARLQQERDALVAKINSLKSASEIHSFLRDNPLTVYFEIGKTELSTKEYAHFETYANALNYLNTPVYISVAGGSDSTTGSATRNSVLRDKRAQYLYLLFIEKFGFDNDKVKIVNGFIDSDTPELSRLGVIFVE